MARLIDADAFLEHWNKEYRHRFPCDMYKTAIANFPTVDAAPVVRCKDCKFIHDKGYCTLVTGMTRIKPDDYCSHGERRTDG